jgi:REP-associated tyrosine transposase
MPSIKINKENPYGSFFLTLTVKNWFYIFDRHNRWDILADSLEFCRKNKGVKLFGFVFMINHVHLVVMSKDMIDFVRSFKTFTSKKIRENIKKTEPNVEKLFLSKENVFSFWKANNMPKIIESEKFLFQKLEYIHNNPVKKQYVMKPEDWY